MAVVPYSGVPKEKPAPDAPAVYNRISASPEAFGAGVGRALQGLGQTVASTALKLSDVYGQAQNDDAQNGAKSDIMKIMHGDPSKTVAGPDGTQVPSPGFLASQGRGAMDSWQATSKQVDDILKSRRAGLTDPAAQRAYDKWAESYKQSVFGQITNHTRAETKTYASEQNKSTMGLSYQDIANNPNDDEIFKRNLEAAKGAAYRDAELKGLAPEARLEATNRAVAGAWETRLDALSVTDPALAYKLAQEHKADFGARYAAIEPKYRVRAEAASGLAIAKQKFDEGMARARAGAGAATPSQSAGQGAGSYLARVRQFESGGDDSAVSPTGATGRYQFTKGTWSETARKHPELGVDPSPSGRLDPVQQEKMMAALTEDNRAGLKAALGREPSDNELYLAHQQGLGGAKSLLSNPTARAGDIVGDLAVRVNNGDPNGTAAQFVDRITSRFSRISGPGTTAIPTQAVTVIGDSIGVGVSQALGASQDHVKVGRSPEQVLDAIKGKDFTGQTIVLSTGASNNPSQIAKIDEQLDALKGAAKITVLGVGDREDFKGVNDAIMSAIQRAKEKGIKVEWAGPLQNLSDDRVHPKDYKAIVAGLALPPGTVAPPGAIAPTGWAAPAGKAGKATAGPVGTRAFAPTQQGFVAPPQSQVVGAPPPAAPQPAPAPEPVIPDRPEPPSMAVVQAESIRSILDDPSLSDGVKQHAISEVNKLYNLEAAQAAGLSVQINQAQKQIVEGYDVPQENFDKLKREVYWRGTPDLVRDFETTEKIRDDFRAFKGMSPREIEAYIGKAEERVQVAGASPRQFEIIEAEQKYLSRLAQDIKSDPIVRAARDGIVGAVQPLALGGSMWDFQASLATRVSQAARVAQVYAQPVRYMTNAEKNDLRQVATAGGDSMITVAASVIDTLGAKSEAFFDEIGDSAPQFAHIGKLMLLGAPGSTLADLAEFQSLSQDKIAAKHIPKLTEGAAQAKSRNIYKGAFQVMGAFGTGAIDAAQKLVEIRAMRSGSDPKLFMDSPIGQQAFQEAAGAVFEGGRQYGGIAPYYSGSWWNVFDKGQHLPIPSSIRAESLSSVFDAITDADLAYDPPDLSNAADRIRGGRLIAIDHGKYRVALGDDPFGPDPKIVRTKSGAPFTLDLTIMEPELRRRVPAAYR